MKELGALKKLRKLNLVETRVTDQGLKELAAIQSLTDVMLMKTAVRNEGVSRLRKALPKCRVFVSPPSERPPQKKL